MKDYDATRRRLKEIVTRYWVYWQVWPEWSYQAGRKEQVGFRLELSGAHPPGCKAKPGCQHCHEVYLRLREVAGWLRPAGPAGRDDCDCTVLPFDDALHYGPSGLNLPDVTLTVLVLHRRVYDRPVDACQVGCLREMERRLRALGATPSRPSPQQDPRRKSAAPVSEPRKEQAA